jgi:PEP-CTERM motif/Thioester domain
MANRACEAFLTPARGGSAGFAGIGIGIGPNVSEKPRNLLILSNQLIDRFFFSPRYSTASRMRPIMCPGYQPPMTVVPLGLRSGRPEPGGWRGQAEKRNAFMRRFFRIDGSLSLSLTFGLLVLLTGEVRADLTVNNIGLYDGGSAQTAYISFTGTNGSFVDVYADPQTATNWSSTGGAIAMYCIDTIHDNAVGNTYNVNPESPPTFSTTSAYTDAANRVAWVMENAGSTTYARGAAQLLIWSIIDVNFSVNWTTTNNSALQTAYTNLVAQMGSGYNPNYNYMPEAHFLAATHVGNLYQDLAYATPEPSTLAIAGLGAIGLIGYGWRKRTRSRVV